jgi:hypothetical protein
MDLAERKKLSVFAIPTHQRMGYRLMVLKLLNHKASICTERNVITFLLKCTRNVRIKTIIYPSLSYNKPRKTDIMVR